MSGLPTTSSFAFPVSLNHQHDTMSDRKLKKPIMEKMRRQRMNDSLNALKDLLLTFAPYDRSAKLEKADILERTVAMIKQIESKRGIPSSVINVQSAMERGRREGFEEGFSCASRAVFDYLTATFPPQTANSQAQQFQMGLINHLRNCLPSTSSSSEPPKKSPRLATDSAPSPSTVTQSNPVTVTASTCESKWSPLTPPSEHGSSPSSSPDQKTVKLEQSLRKRVWQPWN